MSLENILSEILKEGEEEKLNIIRDAREKADNILAKAKREIEEYKESEEEKIKKESQAVKERIITAFELEREKELLKTKKELLDSVFQGVLEKIVSLPKEEYLSFLARLILEYAQTGEELLYLSEHDKGLVDKAFLDDINKKLRDNGKAGNVKLAEESVPISGGVILGVEKIRINASLELILEDARERWEKEVGQILFS